MINKNFFKKLKQEYSANVGERRQIISRSNDILHGSKRAIFGLHRGNIEEAGKSIAEIEECLKYLEKKFGFTRLVEEGSYKAGVEEYVEAKMFFLLLTGKKIDQIKGIKIDNESYLGGISDVTGELIRLAVNRVAEGKAEEVEKIKKLINDIMSEMVEFDFTGYLRTKYDQARGNLKKIEQIDYEIKLRK